MSATKDSFLYVSDEQGDLPSHLLNDHRQESYPAQTPLFPKDRVTTGFDFHLCLLVVNGLVSVAWGIALLIFSFGVVPIFWGISEFGQRHTGITNVVVTAVATLSTAHLKFTVQKTVQEYAKMSLYEGYTIPKWRWMQGVVGWSIWPPFNLWTHRRATVLWLLVYVESFYKHVLFDDPMPCGVDPTSLTLNPVVPVQSSLDQIAFGIGMQLGNYYAQVGKNTTTSVGNKTYVKDNFGYAELGGLINGLQEVPGVAVAAQCSNSPDASSISSLWSSAFPGRALPTVDITNGTGTFIGSLESTSSQSIVTSAASFNLTGLQTAMYAVVNSSGSGGVITTDAKGVMIGCVWSSTPRLVHVETLDFVSIALPSSDDATTVPAPVGRAVLSAVQGMAQAIRLGARLDLNFGSGIPGWDVNLGVGTPVMLQTLISDGIKGALGAYTTYCVGPARYNTTLMGAEVCRSNNRTLSQHWRFGNDHYLGWLAILMTTGFGVLALGVVCRLRKRPRMRGIDPLKVIDAFKLGLKTTDDRVLWSAQILVVRDGKVTPRDDVSWGTAAGGEYVPLRGRDSY